MSRIHHNPLPRTRVKIGFIPFGQSNETGRAPVSEMSLNPQAFQSLIHPNISHLMDGLSVIDKIDADSYGPQGGPWMKVYDELWQHGYQLCMANCSIGSSGFVEHGVGRVQIHSTNSNLFTVRRSPVHPSDPGTAGTVIVEDGKVFELVVGSETYTYLKNNSADSGVHAGANLYQLMGATPMANGLTFNPDGVHLDSAGALVAGGYHADAIKQILPKRVVTG